MLALSAWLGTRLPSLAVGLMLSLVVPSRALADEPSAEAAAEAQRSDAKSKFEEGVAAFREHRYADAVQAFLRADALAPSAALSFNIARAFERLDNPSSALRWYRDYLRRSPQAANAAEVQTRVTELSAKIAERGVQQISVLSTPNGAAVLIDNRAAGVTPITIELAPGAHHLHLRLAGYRDQQADIVLGARTPQDVVVRLEPAPTTQTSAGPPEKPDSTPRSPVKPERPFGIAPLLLVGAGGASLIAAFSFELARRSAESEAERAPQREYQDHYETMRSRQTTARVLAGVGGALLVTGGVLFVLNTSREGTPQLAVGCTDVGCEALALGSF